MPRNDAARTARAASTPDLRTVQLISGQAARPPPRWPRWPGSREPSPTVTCASSPQSTGTPAGMHTRSAVGRRHRDRRVAGATRGPAGRPRLRVAANVATAGPGMVSRVIAGWSALALLIAVKVLSGMLEEHA